MLAFVAAGCAPCEQLLPELTEWQGTHDRLTVALIVDGGGSREQEWAGAPGVAATLFQRDREVAGAYGVYGAPSAVLVGTDQTIVSPVALGADAIRALVADLRLSSSGPGLLPRIGTLAGLGAAGAELGALAPAAAGASDPEIEAIKATIMAEGPTVVGDIDALSNALIKLGRSKQRRPSLRSAHAAVAGQIQHALDLRAQLAAATATTAPAQATRDAAITSVDDLVLAFREFDRMIGLRSKRKRKSSRKRASALLEQAAAAGYFANVGLGCAGEGC